MTKFLLAGAALSLLAAPATAQDAAQVHDARCAYVKSVVLGQLMDSEEPDQAVVQGVTAHVLYYFGRLEAVLDRPTISDLMVSEAQTFETMEQIADAESVCDAGMEGTMDFMFSVSERLSEVAK